MSGEGQFTPTEDPVILLPTPEQLRALPPEEAVRLLQAREEVIRQAAYDPYRYGWCPPIWRRADELLLNHSELLIMGQNRSGKTRYASRKVVETLVEAPRRLVACFHSSEQSSINQQQPAIYEMLPPEWRSLGREGSVTYVKFTQQNGFSGAKFTLPNGSQCLFFNYKQDVKVMEGYEFDLVWMDELVPLAFLEALEFRLGRSRRMLLLITFTPVEGYTPAVGRYLAGAKVVETAPAQLLDANKVHVPGCPRGHMPLIMQCHRPHAAVLFFHWGCNPYGANDEVRMVAEALPEAKRKIRLYGWVDKPMGGAFRKFGDAHIVTRAQFEELAKRGGTRYMSVDPAGAKNWFIKWYFVTPLGHTIVYREWPDEAQHGAWAETPSDGAEGGVRRYQWRPGPAQFSEAGRGIVEYKRLILEAEGWVWDEAEGRWVERPEHMGPVERIERRLMDPRMGGAEVPGENEGTSIIAMMGEEQVDARGRVIGPEMEFEPAPASGVEETVQMINERMDWNTEAPKTVLNCPRWYVVEDCRHSILAYREFTASGGEKDALKDIVDPDRYFVKADCEHVEPGSLKTFSRWGA